MNIDDVDMDKNGTKRENFTKYFRVGRLPETGRKETMLTDIEKKQAHLIELIEKKEEVEEAMCSAGNIQHVYRSLNEV